MSFFRKLLIYLFGVGLGLLIVIFMFGSRTDIQCSYFPNQRVLNDLRQKDSQYAPVFEAQLADFAQGDSLIVYALERGEIDFGASEPRREPCGTYAIDLPEEALRFTVENCDSVIRFIDLRKL